MPQNKEKGPPIVSFTRRLFLGIYLLVAVTAVGLTFASVIAHHVGGTPIPIKGKQISAKGEEKDDLRSCQKSLAKLLADLEQEAFALQDRGVRFETDPDAEWKNWSAGWTRRWRAVEWRCRLGEFAKDGANPVLEELSSIHSALEETRLAFGVVVENHLGEFIRRTRALRRKLKKSRAIIDAPRTNPKTARSLPTGAKR